MRQRFVFAQPLAPFLVVEAVAHRLPIGTHHGQVHLGDDVGQDSLDRNRVGDHRLDAFGPRLSRKVTRVPLRSSPADMAILPRFLDFDSVFAGLGKNLGRVGEIVRKRVVLPTSTKYSVLGHEFNYSVRRWSM